MYEDERDKWREQCERNKISWARAQIGHLNPGIVVHIREWIDEQERTEAAAEAATQRQLAKEAIDAARESVEIARHAADASRRSARWTMWAAVAAAISAVVPFLQAIGWLPK